MDEFVCVFCGQPIEERERPVAPCWVDPHEVSVIAHYLCTSMFDGLPAWPREQRWLKRDR